MWKDTLKRYDELVANCSRFERKGKSMPYTSANGHMFSLLNKDGELGIRFSKPIQDKYLNEFETTLFKSHGAVMRGYIRIPETLLDNTELMTQLLDESYEYVMTLDPK